MGGHRQRTVQVVDDRENLLKMVTFPHAHSLVAKGQYVWLLFGRKIREEPKHAQSNLLRSGTPIAVETNAMWNLLDGNSKHRSDPDDPEAFRKARQIIERRSPYRWCRR